MEDVAFPFHLYQYDPCPVATKKRQTRVVHYENADIQQIGESIQIVAGQRHAKLHTDTSSQRVEVSERSGAIKVSKGGARRVPQHYEDTVIVSVGGRGVVIVVGAPKGLPLEELGVGHEDLCGNQPVS